MSAMHDHKRKVHSRELDDGVICDASGPETVILLPSRPPDGPSRVGRQKAGIVEGAVAQARRLVAHPRVSRNRGGALVSPSSVWTSVQQLSNFTKKTLQSTTADCLLLGQFKMY